MVNVQIKWALFGASYSSWVDFSILKSVFWGGIDCHFVIKAPKYVQAHKFAGVGTKLINTNQTYRWFLQSFMEEFCQFASL